MSKNGNPRGREKFDPSTIAVVPLQIPIVHGDEQEAKRRRNRLAQRKHRQRQRVKSNAGTETDKPAYAERESGTSTSSISFDFDQPDEPVSSSLDFLLADCTDMDHHMGQTTNGSLDVDREAEFLLASLGAPDMDQQEDAMGDHHNCLAHHDVHHDLAPMGFHRVPQPSPMPIPQPSEAKIAAPSFPMPTPHIIRAVQGAGFESIDDMATQYYTSQFEEDTASYWAQSLSRSHSLYTFLSSLHRSTSAWSERDIQRYRQQILAAAESLYASEIDTAKNSKDVARPPTPASSVEALWRMMGDMDLDQEAKEKKMAIREKLPETWSLLARLTQKADLRQPQGSQVVFAFLLLLVESNRNQASQG
ncbi:hypothetical protein F5144DRAFT_595503 [Chaetomium tenue]|uniref:Uncharacterized protein n=1 Tax=Chaetomium tenue TaxID=1854479 RepID=A0ACB7NYB3_9PEZI|nr:hypothetical protein F5144DRAFT_595503 [Chaetomium globosum]